MAEKKYDYTDVVVTVNNYNLATGEYVWAVQTKSFWTLEFKLKKLAQPKTTQNGHTIVAEISLNGDDPIGIFKNDRDGKITFGGTVKAGEFFINIKPLVTAGDIKDYKITFVEKIGLLATTIAPEQIDDTF